MTLLKFFLLMPALVLMALGASGQTALGKHPADMVLPGFFNQNSNAETTVTGINHANVKVTNVDWTLGGSGTSDYNALSNTPPNIVTNTANGVGLNGSFTGNFAGTFAGDASGAVNLNGANLTAGTVNSNAFDAATLGVLEGAYPASNPGGYQTAAQVSTAANARQAGSGVLTNVAAIANAPQQIALAITNLPGALVTNLTAALQQQQLVNPNLNYSVVYDINPLSATYGPWYSNSISGVGTAVFVWTNAAFNNEILAWSNTPAFRGYYFEINSSNQWGLTNGVQAQPALVMSLHGGAVVQSQLFTNGGQMFAINGTGAAPYLSVSTNVYQAPTNAVYVLQGYGGPNDGSLLTNFNVASQNYVTDNNGAVLTNNWNITSFATNPLAQVPVNSVMRMGAMPAPPMGFQVYGAYGDNFTGYDYTNLVYAMVTNGWVAAGWNLIIVDSANATNRDVNGHWIPAVIGLQTSPTNGGNGELNSQITNLYPAPYPAYHMNLALSVPWGLSMGVKTGVYTEPNTEVLSAPYLGSGGYLASDAAWFASNGVAYVKYDCGNVLDPASMAFFNLTFANDLDATGTPIILDGSIDPGSNWLYYVKWQEPADNLLRVQARGNGWGMDQPGGGTSTGGIVTNYWIRELYNVDNAMVSSWLNTPGHIMSHEAISWNTTNTLLATFSMAAVLGEPLISYLCPDDPTYALHGSWELFQAATLKNPDIISIDQDPAQAPPVFVLTNGFDPTHWAQLNGTGFVTNNLGPVGYEIIARPLGSRTLVAARKMALEVVNRDLYNPNTITCNFTNLMIPTGTPVYCKSILQNLDGSYNPAGTYFWATNAMTFTLTNASAMTFFLWPQLSLSDGPSESLRAGGVSFGGVDIPTNTLGTHGYSGYYTNGIFVSTGTY